MKALGYSQNPGMVPLTVISVVWVKQPPLSERERKIRNLIRLLERSKELKPKQRARLARLFEEFEGELEQILAENSLHERCCIDAPCNCEVKVVGHYSGVFAKSRPRDIGESREEVICRNAAGEGHRIKPRRLGF